jgi:hypothetical protein
MARPGECFVPKDPMRGTFKLGIEVEGEEHRSSTGCFDCLRKIREHNRRQNLLSLMRKRESVKNGCPAVGILSSGGYLVRISLAEESTVERSSFLPPSWECRFSRTSISGTAVIGRQPIRGRFLCVLTHFTSRMCKVRRNYPINGSCTRIFALTLLEIGMYLDSLWFADAMAESI